jgi:hypothetical protein
MAPPFIFRYALFSLRLGFLGVTCFIFAVPWCLFLVALYLLSYCIISQSNCKAFQTINKSAAMLNGAAIPERRENKQ